MPRLRRFVDNVISCYKIDVLFMFWFEFFLQEPKNIYAAKWP